MKISFLSAYVFVFSIVSLSTSAYAENSKLEDGQMVFAVGYGTLSQSMNNYVLIGDYKFKDKSFTAEYKEFDANADLKPKKAGFHHTKLEAPYGKRACEDKVIDIPSESAERSFRGTWQVDGKILKLVIDTQTYEWEAEDGDEGGYKLRKIRDNIAKRDLPLAVGFAYLSKSQNSPARLDKQNFLPYYRGDIYHKNNNAIAKSSWDFKASGLKVSAFSESDNGDVLNYSSLGSAENKGAWVGNSLLLNHNEKSVHTIYQDLGHDFNKNGCYDEYGHNKILLAAYTDASLIVRNMVYIEYSYAYDGFPLLSVGRYYR
jgi:hypothetical protein